MKKTAAAIVFLLINIFIFTSCIMKGEDMFFYTDDKIAENRMGQVVKALEEQAKVALKNMFSNHSLNDSTDFDENLNRLFNIFQGELNSHDFDYGPVSEKIEYGKREKEIKVYFNIDIQEESYSFFLVDYPTNTLNPDNKGLYTLRVTNFEEDLSWQEKIVPGIFIMEK